MRALLSGSGGRRSAPAARSPRGPRRRSRGSARSSTSRDRSAREAATERLAASIDRPPRSRSASAARSFRSIASRAPSATSLVQVPQKRLNEADLAQVDLEILDPDSVQRVEDEPEHLDIGLRSDPSPISSAPSWKTSRRCPPPSSRLAVDLSRIAQPQWDGRIRELGRRHARDARGEVRAQRDEPPVLIDEADQPAARSGPRRGEHLLVLERRGITSSYPALGRKGSNQAA
jgi:hypothetical protein